MIDFAIGLARQAGALVREAYVNRRVQVTALKGEELVTNLDRLVESHIARAIQARFPDHGVVGEEGTGERTQSERCWYVDPIDGTYNMVRKIPYFCVSLALASGTAIDLGVIHNPITGETFWATKGGGAFLDGSSISVSQCNDLSDAGIGMSERSSNAERMRRIRMHMYTLMGNAHRVRVMGSTVLDLAYVACGRLDARVKISSHPWDTAAGTLLVREARGRVTDFEGHDAQLSSVDLIASNGLLHEGLMEALRVASRPSVAR